MVSLRTQRTRPRKTLTLFSPYMSAVPVLSTGRGCQAPLPQASVSWATTLCCLHTLPWVSMNSPRPGGFPSFLTKYARTWGSLSGNQCVLGTMGWHRWGTSCTCRMRPAFWVPSVMCALSPCKLPVLPGSPAQAELTQKLSVTVSMTNGTKCLHLQ